jgi:hypothetical protein
VEYHSLPVTPGEIEQILNLNRNPNPKVLAQGIPDLRVPLV